MESRHVADSIERMRGLLKSVETAREPFDLGHICHSAVLASKSLAAKHGVQVTVSDPPATMTIVGDASQMQLAVGNLVVNAIEAFAEHTSPAREIRIELVGSQDVVVCVVGDSGPGLQAALHAGGAPVIPKPGGTGMGLHIVRAVLDNHRGRLEMGRSPLGGAEFRIVLPRE